MITEEMKTVAAALRLDCVKLRTELGFLEAWANLERTMMWEAISGHLEKLEDIAKNTCIANGTSESQWRESAAEARVYRWLRMRPEGVKPEMERIASDLREREAEIKRLENLTKGV